MNLRVFPYYTVDHPLKKGEKIIISNRSEIQKTGSRVFEISENPSIDRARLIRVHISDGRSDRNKDSERIKNYEKRHFDKERIDFKKAKTDEIFRFTRSLIIAYLLYSAPESFWAPLVSLFNLIAHGLSDYARWCIIAFFPLKGLIRSFGTLLFIKTPGKMMNIGIPGRWHNIHKNSKMTEIYKRLDQPVRETLEKEIDEYIKNLIDKDKSDNQLIVRISSLLKNIMDSKNITEIDKQLQACIIEGEKGILWGEMVKLNMLRKEILYFLSSEGCNFSNLYHFYPYEENSRKPPVAMADIKFRSFASQSMNLQQFNNLTQVIKLKESIYERKETLINVENSRERIRLLEQISTSFEKLRDEAGRFHMGQNLFVPHEKGNDIALFYHHLFLLTGRALCDLENKYRRAYIGFLPLRNERAQKKRVEKLFDELYFYLEARHEKKWKNGLTKISVLGGNNLGTGLAVSLLLLFLTGSLLSFFIIDPGDKMIRSDLKIGYMDSFLNRETTITESKKTRIGWHLPQPLSRHSIVSSEEQKLSVYMIIGEHYTENPLKKLLSALSGQLGTKFDVIQLKISYTPNDIEKWSLYNNDGKGERRLLRDISELAEEWKNKRGRDLTSFTNSDFEKYFRELADQGVIEEYLKRSFSQTSFSTNLYYGSLSERFESGINAVISEFEKTIIEAENNLFLEEKEKDQLKTELQKATTIVKDLQADINDQVTVDYSLLRSNPEILNQIIKNPFENIQKLKDFETLWVNITSYVQHLYRQKQIFEMLSSGYVDLSENKETLDINHQQLDLAEFLQNNNLIKELIDIQSVIFDQKVIGLTEFTQYQEKWKETI